jgi:hypothetical protein
MKERVHAEHRPNPRDAEGKKTDQVKSAWRKYTHQRKEVPGVGDQKTRHRWVRLPGSMSLREFARRQGGAAGERWLWNKRTNTSKPPLGVGSTRKKKGSGNQGQKQADAAAPSANKRK